MNISSQFKLVSIATIIAILIVLFIACNDEDPLSQNNKTIDATHSKNSYMTISFMDSTLTNVIKLDSNFTTWEWLHYRGPYLYFKTQVDITEDLFSDVYILTTDTIINEYVINSSNNDSNSLTISNLRDTNNSIVFNVCQNDINTIFNIQCDSLNATLIKSYLLSTRFIPNPISNSLSKSNLPVTQILRGVAYILSIIVAIKDCSEEKEDECNKKIVEESAKCVHAGGKVISVDKKNCRISCAIRRQ